MLESRNLHRHLIVVGASYGGIEATTTFLAALPADLPCPVVIVQHTSPHRTSRLAEVYARATALVTSEVKELVRMLPGHVYIAPPDYHLLVRDGELILSLAPRENRSRPAVNPLFRSAAVAFGGGVIGVILSGSNDDGSSGLRAIKECGGIALVQDPAEALAPQMPTAAIRRTEVDHIAPATELGHLAAHYASLPVENQSDPPPELLAEVTAMLRIGEPMGSRTEIGERERLSCPECGGPLNSVDDGETKRFRCAVGHSFTPSALLDGQARAVETALWSAVRTLEERGDLLDRMRLWCLERGLEDSAAVYDRQRRDVVGNAELLRRLLIAENGVASLSPNGEPLSGST